MDICEALNNIIARLHHSSWLAALLSIKLGSKIPCIIYLFHKDCLQITSGGFGVSTNFTGESAENREKESGLKTNEKENNEYDSIQAKRSNYSEVLFRLLLL